MVLLRPESEHTAALSLWSALLPDHWTLPLVSKRERAAACLLFTCRNGLVLAVDDSELVPVCFCPGRNGNANHCIAALAAGGGSVGVTFYPTCHPLYTALRWISVSLLTVEGWAGFIPPFSVCSGAPPPGV